MGSLKSCKKALINYGYSKADIAEMSADEIREEAEELEDTSWAHPNESWKDFCEHENFGY